MIRLVDNESARAIDKIVKSYGLIKKYPTARMNIPDKTFGFFPPRNITYFINQPPKYTIKLFKAQRQNRTEYFRESVAYKIFNIERLHMPKLIAEGKVGGYYFICRKYVDGDNFRAIYKKLDTKKKYEIFYSFGKMLKYIHGTNESKLQDKIKHNEDIFKAEEISLVNDQIEQIKNTPFCSFYRRIKAFADKNLGLLSNSRIGIVHGDFQDKNIIIKQGKVAGLIDFENLKIGIQEKEVALGNMCSYTKFSLKERTSFQDKILDGYGYNEADRDEFWTKYNVYCFFNIVGFIASGLTNNNSVARKRIKRELEYILR